MELNEMEKKLLFQVEGDYQAKVLNELYMTVRYSSNSEQREAAQSLMAKLRVLSDAECMDLVKDIQKPRHNSGRHTLRFSIRVSYARNYILLWLAC